MAALKHEKQLDFYCSAEAIHESRFGFSNLAVFSQNDNSPAANATQNKKSQTPKRKDKNQNLSMMAQSPDRGPK